MIEPSGQPVALPPNRQSKVSAYAGQAQAGKKQKHVYPQAQDTADFGGQNTKGIGDNVKPVNEVLSRGSVSAQDSDSVVTALGGLGDANKGTENWEGHKSIGGDLRAGTLTSDQVKPAPRLKFNDQAALKSNPWLMD